ncbi:putative quinone oxidoreductase [Toxoplasma gondii CAST]|uniref:Putative quinone oxidoreductase n=1 Tax=Toxoplasma gondii CAST TaxID=943122 RepID=A0A3R8A862_TOXGO|nr:putative quinone oxidoreductase [Toxoplasma gondii CAST]
MVLSAPLRRLPHMMRAVLVDAAPLSGTPAVEAKNQQSFKLFLGSAAMPQARKEKNEILIRVCAAGVNRMDLLQKRGKYPPPPGASTILGPEAAGVVASSGTRFREGDRVMALLQGGGYAEYVAVEEGLCMPIPSTLSFSQAAAIPENWLTAYQLLHFVAGLQPASTPSSACLSSSPPSSATATADSLNSSEHGERQTDACPFVCAGASGRRLPIRSVLIHAAASGVGTALVQLCRLLAIPTIIASAGSDEKLQLCKTLGATHLINHRAVEGRFSEAVKNATHGLGVDLLLDPVGASFMQENAQSCALDASWVLYGALGGVRVPSFDLQLLFAKRIRLLSSTLRSQDLSYRESLVRSFEETILPKLADSSLRVILDSIYTASEADQAHQRLEKNENRGKVVLTFPCPS